MSDDLHFMRMAIEQGRLAQAAGEVPVGAVVVKEGRIVGVGRNAPIGTHDPSAHAEIMALRAAAVVLGNYRLDGCDLYVTLEPCAMCAGAMLHARVRRVVFGAADPKTGAAGSVVNLFDHPDLNHHTRVQGGVLAASCASLLHNFFSEKRAQKARTHAPLRDDALRTPDQCFDGLCDYPWAPRYVNNLPTLEGLRLHYLDEGAPDATRTILCLHGYPTWSFLFRKMVPGLLDAGYRVVVPDLLGFGKSDKPKKPGFHTLASHSDYLVGLIDLLGLRNLVVVGQGEGGILAAALVQARPDCVITAMHLLPMQSHAMSEDVPNKTSRAGSVVAAQVPHLTEAERQAYDAPFVDAGYGAALKALHPEAKTAWSLSMDRAPMHRADVLRGSTSIPVGDFLPEAGAEVVRQLLDRIQG
jgi:tRNA(adenine34) deaminase